MATTTTSSMVTMNSYISPSGSSYLSASTTSLTSILEFYVVLVNQRHRMRRGAIMAIIAMGLVMAAIIGFCMVRMFTKHSPNKNWQSSDGVVANHERMVIGERFQGNQNQRMAL
ncbi:uncharacterized protein LY89DRAFT_736608 [Mollisia scopiformis]|uniref:Uncharacterized protein n=1 Tax=Mollisia scopiformis TaxID=149040 RepID=A0A194X310_MOLSC|nr:uncharacterized protein LY89DRAFT_736608 [Mollisia scopiformis]KUJ14580.1 hypothetical protein LY89DRAFT_736608 [Mollisia scopiformis]